MKKSSTFGSLLATALLPLIAQAQFQQQQIAQKQQQQQQSQQQLYKCDTSLGGFLTGVDVQNAIKKVNEVDKDGDLVICFQPDSIVLTEKGDRNNYIDPFGKNIKVTEKHVVLQGSAFGKVNFTNPDVEYSRMIDVLGGKLTVLNAKFTIYSKWSYGIYTSLAGKINALDNIDFHLLNFGAVAIDASSDIGRINRAKFNLRDNSGTVNGGSGQTLAIRLYKSNVADFGNIEVNTFGAGDIFLHTRESNLRYMHDISINGTMLTKGLGGNYRAFAFTDGTTVGRMWNINANIDGSYINFIDARDAKIGSINNLTLLIKGDYVALAEVYSITSFSPNQSYPTGSSVGAINNLTVHAEQRLSGFIGNERYLINLRDGSTIGPISNAKVTGNVPLIKK